MAVLDVFILLVTVFSLVYFRVPILLWILVVGSLLGFMTWWDKTHWIFLALFWFFYLTAVAFVLLKNWRQRYFTLPLMNKLKNQMPSISSTEREAIEAGNVWWEKDLFCGKPNWKHFLAMPKPTLTPEEESFINNQVESLCNLLNDWDIVQKHRDLSPAVWDFLKKERFFGLVIPKEYGGHGFSALAHSTIVVKIATRSISAAVNTMVPNSLGPGELLLHYGTEEQKNYYLPRLAKGEDIPCFALTGPEAGSDAGAITDFGIVCKGEFQGKEVLGIRLTWDKRYITLAPIATLLGIAFRLYDPENLLGKEAELGITLCLVSTTLPGVEIGDRHWPLQLAFMNGPTRGKDIFIPLDSIIGGIARIGQGWKMLMECLSIGRSISLPALSTACCKVAYRATGAYARLRRQFNTAIAHFEGVEEALGNIAGLTYTTEATRLFTASAVDQQIKPAIASAIAKYHMTEMARQTISNAMDIHAGHAIQVGPRNVLANLHFSGPVSITVEGANILTRNLIIFGQGAIRCHPYVLKEIELFSDPNEEMKLKKFDKLLLSHMGYLMSNLAKTCWRGITGGFLIFSPIKGPIAYYYRQISRMSSALALLSDLSMMMLGGSLKRKERLSARLGDILSQLYLSSAVLKYFNDNGSPDSDRNYVRWCIEMSLHKMELACVELTHNFPIRWLGRLMLGIIFPFGRTYPKPSDYLYHQIVNNMLEPSEFRDRLTRYCFISQDASDALRRLDLGLSELASIEPLLLKFQKALRKNLLLHRTFEEQIEIIRKTENFTENEINALREFDELQKEIIKVNEFTFDLSSVVS